jgi:hypothetical protein
LLDIIVAELVGVGRNRFTFGKDFHPFVRQWVAYTNCILRVEDTVSALGKLKTISCNFSITD